MESLAPGASKGFGISSLSSKDLLLRINWNKYISRGGGGGKIVDQRGTCCLHKERALHLAAESIRH